MEVCDIEKSCGLGRKHIYSVQKTVMKLYFLYEMFTAHYLAIDIQNFKFLHASIEPKNPPNFSSE